MHVQGTHALLGKTIKFSERLGLLVVDEEQRFGVAQKERMKVHLLLVVVCECECECVSVSEKLGLLVVDEESSALVWHRKSA